MINISFCGDIRLLFPTDVTVSNELHEALLQCELNVINFEVPVQVVQSRPIKKSGPVLCQSEGCPKWIEKEGWNVVSFANNHILDYGEDSFDYSKSLFTKARTIGGGTYEDAYCVNEFITNDNRIVGMVAGTHREFGVLTEREDSVRRGCAWVCHPDFIKTIVEARSKVDILIAYIHAGVEEFEQPLPEWRLYYRTLIDLGCDAIICSHPHVPQGWETYRGKPIFYSLGNFCFQKEGNIFAPYWNKSLFVVLTFDEDSNLSYNVYPIEYETENSCIKMDKTEITKEHIKSLNSVLNNQTCYNDFINYELPKYWEDYKMLFGLSGFVSNPISKSYLRSLRNKLLNKEHNMTHVLNNLQNESHRWAIERIIRINSGIKY